MSEGTTAASAAAAARELATVLLDQAEALDLHDLRATDAIEQVRVKSRALADAVHERGWGELYLGIDSMFPEPGDLVEDVLDDEDDIEDDAAWLGDDDDEGYGEELLPAEGLRLSYQARYDFVVTDPEALVAYVRRHAAEVGSDEVLAEIEDPVSAFQLLTFVDGLGSKDYADMGLGPAGGEESQKVVEHSLWDLDPTRRDDTYPY
ncbi:MAG TPA: hypothetical protein VEK80_12465 [Kribbellaceae bacterium]|nr:hypothetical protein [Kribbellaceae bacterium]